MSPIHSFEPTPNGAAQFKRRSHKEATVSAETAIREVIATIEASWKAQQLAGLEACFHERAVIVGPGYAEYARGREKCAGSYRELAANADVLAYSESAHELRVWEHTAVYTFAWAMSYQREQGPKAESGTDQLVFENTPAGWQVVWRYIYFEPSKEAATGT